MIPIFPRLFTIACLLVLAGPARPAETSASAPLGSPDFRPTLEHPFGWRGDGSGCFPGAAPALEWSAAKNVRWSAAVGPGYSSPILTEKLVFVTAEPDLLVCLDRADGRVVWKQHVTSAVLSDPQSRKAAEAYKLPKDGSGMAAATPITDGRSVYALFANGILCAVDLEGRPQWALCIDAEQNTVYGRSASPIVVAGMLIVHLNNLYAFNPASGKQLWVNTEAKSSYGTPVAVQAGGAAVIVTPAGDVVRAADGVSLDSGVGHTTQSSPVGAGGNVFFGDGQVSAVRLDPAGKAAEFWNGMLSGEVFGSPLLCGGTFFIATGDGALSAFNAAGKGTQDPFIDGRALLENTGSGPAAFASLTLAGNSLFLSSNAGETVVLQATREAPLLSRNRLPAGSGSSPVFSGKDLYLRAGDRLFCIGQ